MLDGTALLRELRREPALSAVCCVAVPARAMRHDIDAALAQGFADCLVKPVAVARLLETVDRLCAAR